MKNTIIKSWHERMDTIKTTQSDGMPLSPVGNNIPNATTQTAENGTEREIDSGAKLKDERPYSTIFAEELEKGNLDQFENPNQVNKYLQSLKGASSPCTFFVNARSHGWARVGGKWTAPTTEWLKANPFQQGARISKAGMLSDEEVTAIKAQLAALDLVPEAVKPTVQAIIDGLNAKLTAHEKAIAEQAISKERIRARTAACTAFEGILKLADKAGKDWGNDVALALASIGAILKLDKVSCLSCLASLVGTDVAKEGTDLFKRFGHTF